MGADAARHEAIASELKRINNGGKSIKARTFTFQDLAAATNNFKNESLLGEGGFGRVYKGSLENTNQVPHSPSTSQSLNTNPL